MLEEIKLYLKTGFFDASPCNMKFIGSKIVLISTENGKCLYEFKMANINSVNIYRNIPVELEIITDEKIHLLTFPKSTNFTCVLSLLQGKFENKLSIY
jgi:hypothetical protein